MLELQWTTTEATGENRLESSGQVSAELILIIGGLIIIIIAVGNYISTISNTTQESLKKVIDQERNYVINRI